MVRAVGIVLLVQKRRVGVVVPVGVGLTVGVMVRVVPVVRAALSSHVGASFPGSFPAGGS
jgi:hypothetical protein